MTHSFPTRRSSDRVAYSFFRADQFMWLEKTVTVSVLLILSEQNPVTYVIFKPFEFFVLSKCIIIITLALTYFFLFSVMQNHVEWPE